ncbi:hypothetical protein M8J76_001293 [Diaphorina citri]|nr:hypothetical protein M8J75_005652 [Diaphorina citri]KAI5736235.1 hypothetical protein M8J76_001293 [Diaphorina citri]
MGKVQYQQQRLSMAKPSDGWGNRKPTSCITCIAGTRREQGAEEPHRESKERELGAPYGGAGSTDRRGEGGIDTEEQGRKH